MCGFLRRQIPPVCLVAHNGHDYDFGFLQAELQAIGASLPHEVLCVDSLQMFRSLDGVEHYPLLSPFTNTRVLTNAPPARDTGNNNKQPVTSEKQFNDNTEMKGDNTDVASGIKVKRKLFVDEDDSNLTAEVNTKKQCHADVEVTNRNGSGSPDASSQASHTTNHRVCFHKNSDSKTMVQIDITSRYVISEGSCSSALSDSDSQRTVTYTVNSDSDHDDDDNTGGTEVKSDPQTTQWGDDVADSLLQHLPLHDHPHVKGSDKTDSTSQKMSANSCDNGDSKIHPTTNSNNLSGTNGINNGVTQLEKGNKNGWISRQDFRVGASDNSVAGCTGKLSDTSCSNGTPSPPSHQNSSDHAKINNAGYTTPDHTPVHTRPASSTAHSVSRRRAGSSPSYNLRELHRRLVGVYPSASHRAEDDSLALVRIFLVSGERAVCWADQHAVPMAEVPPLYAVRKRTPLPRGTFLV